MVEDFDRSREAIDRLLADCHGYPADLRISLAGLTLLAVDRTSTRMLQRPAWPT